MYSAIDGFGPVSTTIGRRYTMEETLQKIYDLVMLYGVKVIAAIAIFIIGRWVAKGFRSLTKRLMDKKNVDPTITGFVGNLTYMALLVFVVIAALGPTGNPDNILYCHPGCRRSCYRSGITGQPGQFCRWVPDDHLQTVQSGGLYRGGRRCRNRRNDSDFYHHLENTGQQNRYHSELPASPVATS